MFPTIRAVGLMMALAIGPAARFAVAAAGDAQGPPRQTSQARAALAAGNGQLALKLLESRTLDITPAERLAVEGHAHFLLGNHAVARRKLTSAIRLRPKQTHDLYWLGRALEACKMPTLAAGRFEQAYWNGLDTADLHYHWAIVLTSLDDKLGKISQQPWPDDAGEPPKPGDFALGGLVIGSVPSNPGRLIVSPPASAIYRAHKAIELESDRGEAILLCGELWAAVNRHEQAVTFFAKASSHLDDRDKAKCHESWAASLLAIGDFDGYLKHARRHLRALGDDVDGAELARCYDRAAAEVAQRGDLKRQIRYLTMAVELDQDCDRLIALADALQQAQRGDDVLHYLQTALALQPSRAQLKQIQRRMQLATYLNAKQ